MWMGRSNLLSCSKKWAFRLSQICSRKWMWMGWRYLFRCSIEWPFRVPQVCLAMVDNLHAVPGGCGSAAANVNRPLRSWEGTSKAFLDALALLLLISYQSQLSVIQHSSAKHLDITVGRYGYYRLWYMKALAFQPMEMGYTRWRLEKPFWYADWAFWYLIMRCFLGSPSGRSWHGLYDYMCNHTP
jgi:hypothetical protein